MLMPLVVGASLLMQFLESVALVTVLPDVARSLGTSPANLSLAVTIYFLAVAMVMPVSGWLAGRYGARTAFQCSVGLFVLASLACGFSQSLPQLIVGRAVQGMTGGLMTPAARLILLQSFPRSQFVRVMLWYSLPALVGPMLGASVAGFFATFANWRWIFFVNTPVGVTAIIAIAFIVRDTRLSDRAPFDKLGFLLVASTIFCTITALEVAAQGGASHYLAASLVAILGLVAGLTTWCHINRHPAPLIDPSLQRFPTYRVAFGSGFAYRVGLSGVIFLLPVLVQSGFGFSAAQASMLAILGAIGMLGIRPLISRMLRIAGFPAILFWNGILSAMSVAIFCLFSDMAPFSLIGFAFLLCGASRSLQFMSLGSIAFAEIPAAYSSWAASFVSTTEQFAVAVGTSIAGISLKLATYWLGAAPEMPGAPAIQIPLGVMAFITAISAFGILKFGERNERARLVAPA